MRFIKRSYARCVVEWAHWMNINTSGHVASNIANNMTTPTNQQEQGAKGSSNAASFQSIRMFQQAQQELYKRDFSATDAAQGEKKDEPAIVNRPVPLGVTAEGMRWIQFVNDLVNRNS